MLDCTVLREMMEVEVAVVGAGVVGCCTALSLQQAGKNTLLIDQYAVPNNHGSSRGQARITRIANFGPRQLNSILVLSHKKWREISEVVGEELISPAPLLVVGSESKPVKTMAESLERTDQHPNWLTPAQTNAKYKTRFTEDYTMFEDTSAGIMRADRCLAAVLKLFGEAGGKVLEEWGVKEVEPGPSSVCLRGPRGVVRARYLVMCPGPWFSSLLQPLGINLPMQPLATRVSFWSNKGFPYASFVDMTNSKNYIYALPAMDSRGLIKLGYHGGLEVSPGEGDLDLNFLNKKVASYVTRYLPLEQEEGDEDCWYTESPDKEFVLDRHPRHHNILCAVGFSGTGFKIAPAVGYILACMVEGRDHGFDISPFAAKRFPNFYRDIKSKF